MFIFPFQYKAKAKAAIRRAKDAGTSAAELQRLHDALDDARRAEREKVEEVERLQREVLGHEARERYLQEEVAGLQEQLTLRQCNRERKSDKGQGEGADGDLEVDHQHHQAPDNVAADEGTGELPAGQQERVAEARAEIRSLEEQCAALREELRKRDALITALRREPQDAGASAERLSEEVRRETTERSAAAPTGRKSERKRSTSATPESLLARILEQPGVEIEETASKRSPVPSPAVEEDRVAAPVQRETYTELARMLRRENRELRERVDALQRAVDEARRANERFRTLVTRSDGHDPEAADSPTNLQYLKNVVVRYLSSDDPSEHRRLLPVLRVLLKLSDAEFAGIMERVDASGGGGSLPAIWGWFGGGGQ